MKFESKAIHSGFSQDPKHGATAVPVFQTASYAFSTAQELADVFEGHKFGHVYSRISNPTVSAFESRITELENGLGSVAVASGMAAIATAIYALTASGDEIISSTNLFGGTFHFFEDMARFGVSTRYVDIHSPLKIKQAITDKTKLIFFETIGNPKLDVPNMKAIVEIANEANIPVVVDSTLTSPYLFQAKKWGVHVVVHSATKYIGIGGTTIGGIIVDLGTFKWRNARSEAVRESAQKAGHFGFISQIRQRILTNTGNILAPFNAFLFSLGLETLSLRLDKQCQNALELAQFLGSHSKVSKVTYPGLENNPYHELAKAQFEGQFGALLTFECPTKEACFHCIDHLKMIKNMTSLGDSKTMVIHPDSTIYRTCSPEQKEAAGVNDRLIRVSVGLEHFSDIINDFNQALSA